MTGDGEIICITCPLGCRMKVDSDSNGNIISVTGNECKLGARYATDDMME